MRVLVPLCLLAALLLLIRSPFHPDDLYTEIPLGSEEISEIYPFLNQRFTYLDEGSQIIAFLSEDGEFVLKLFKKTHKKPFKISRFLAFFTKDRAQSKRKWTLKFQDTCRRYKMAFAELKEETGLLGLHFHKTKDPIFITLSHKKTYQIDLAKVPFILQKRAILAPEFAKAHPEEARNALKELFQTRLDRGFSDPRQTLSKNYGFIEGRAVQLDVGKIERFEGDPASEMALISDRVDQWISKLGHKKLN